MPTTPWGGSRTLVKETDWYGKAGLKAISEALEATVAMKDSPDVVISRCPHLCGRVGGVSVPENSSQVVVISIRPSKGLRPQVLNTHSHGAGEAHPVRLGSTAVHLEKILRDVKNSVSHVVP
jgi:hypothetical protein